MKHWEEVLEHRAWCKCPPANWMAEKPSKRCKRPTMVKGQCFVCGHLRECHESKNEKGVLY